MSKSDSPEVVRSSDGLGLEPERATVRLTLEDLGVLAKTAERNGTQHYFQAVALEWCGKAQAEIERLRADLTKANEQAERFERGWYLRGDALEKLESWAAAYPVKVFPEPLREEWQRAAALLSEKGLSLDRMSASNMRHVIKGVREIVAEGLKA